MARSSPNAEPYIVAVGSGAREASTTERALKLVLQSCEQAGATTCLLTGADIDLPTYPTDGSPLPEKAQRLIDELRRADGVVIGSPGYHGGVAGRVKNALDYIEEMRADDAPYLDGRAVGLIAVAAGWQGAFATLAALRDIVHALRGWPTPIGVAVNTAGDEDPLTTPQVRNLCELMAGQIVTFARWKRSAD